MMAKRINGQKLAVMIVFRALDPERGPWEPIKKDHVPAWITDNPDIMGDLVRGLVIQNEEDDPPYAYRGERRNGFTA